MIRTLLVANRGEIAVRIIRAAREMGIRTVAVFSEADAGQMHAAIADQAIALGGAEPSASYLDAGKILEAARIAGADAVHPGYGFLSERAEFAQACREAGFRFVGPGEEAMRKLGSKISAKKAAIAVGVPVTPGYFEPGAGRQALRGAAREIGYPVLLKASAGGGGRGMRLVPDDDAFDAAWSIASQEALSAFGDSEMMVEKLIERPRHIEVQVLADGHGSVACLFERECSIQRRHQKLIEESPSPAMSADLWQRMGSAARRLTEASGYANAGTIEFMVDEASGEFYFLEVNARLQVEHPVTEAITGIDLVKWQIRIASGERLTLAPALIEGDRAAMSGHAIEARVVAEDPAADFRPAAGRILAWALPVAPGVRIDTGYREGADVPRHYDSLLAKVIARGETRDEAIRRLESALLDFHVLGVPTNIGYLLDVMRHADFRSGRLDTDFLNREFAGWQPEAAKAGELAAIGAAAGRTGQPERGENRRPALWEADDSFRLSR